MFNVDQFTAPARTPSAHAFLPAPCTLHPTIAARGPGHLYCVVQQRPRLAEQERDTFYTTQAHVSTRAILRPAWTRNTRMSAAWPRLTRPPSSKKVPRPAVPSGSGDELALWELTRRSASIQPEPRLTAEMQSGMLNTNNPVSDLS